MDIKKEGSGSSTLNGAADGPDRNLKWILKETNMKTSIIVQNLKCGGCAHTITSKLSGLEGISNLEVNTETAAVSFVHEHADDVLRVGNALRSLGYPAIDQKNSMGARAMSYFSCAVGKVSKP